MELYPHNMRAYEVATRILEEKNKTCIIHPTGTGKAVIIAKFIIDRPQSAHLVFAPGGHIFTEIKKHTTRTDVIFRTYSSIRSEKDVDQLKGLDYIYLDEFHRIGAEIWGPWIIAIIAANPRAKLLGTTATHIRFLDGQRDMAAELFNNNIASHISLNRAFAEGILRVPVYVNAMYSIEEEYSAFTTNINYSNHDNKKLLVTHF